MGGLERGTNVAKIYSPRLRNSLRSNSPRLRTNKFSLRSFFWEERNVNTER